MVGYLQKVRRRMRREMVYSHYLLYAAVTNPSLSFRMRQSHMNNLPLYLDYRNGRSQIVIQIIKTDGDVIVCWRE